MGFSLATAWVDIGAKTVNFDRAIANVKRQITSLRGSFSALSGHALALWGTLAGAGGLAGFAIKNFMEEERGQERLRSALRATGQEVDSNATRLIAFAAHMQSITVYDKEATTGLMAFATNLGVTAAQMEGVIKVGMGLGEALFGGDAQAGIEAAAKAQQGNFREIQRMSKAVRDAVSPQEKLNAVVKLGNQGFQQAQDRTRTLEGRMKQLWNTVNDTSRGFGRLLADSMTKTIDQMRVLAEFINNLDDKQKSQIITWAKYAAGMAAVLVFGPRLLSFAIDLTSVFTSVGKTLLSVGQLMIAGLFTPVGMIIGGLALAATAFAYFTGTGVTATQKVASGFGQLFNVVDTFTGSASRLMELWDIVVGTTANNMLRVWEYVKFAFKEAWSFMSQAVLDTLDTAWSTVKSWGTNVINFFQRLAMQIQHAWTAMTDFLGDKLAKLMLMLPKKLGGQGMTGDQADKSIDAARKNTDAAAEDEYQKRLGGFNQRWQSELDKMDSAWAGRMNKRGGDAEADRKQYAADLKKHLDELDAAQGKDDASRANRMMNDQAKTLREKFKELMADVAKGVGLDEVQKKFEALRAQFEKTKDGSNEGGSLGLNAAATKPQFTGIEEAFKKNLEGQFSGISDARKAQRLNQQQYDLSKQQLAATLILISTMAGLPKVLTLQ